MKFRFSLFVVNHEGEQVEVDQLEFGIAPIGLGVGVGAMRMLEVLDNKKKDFVVAPGTTVQLVAVALEDDHA